MYLTHLVVLFPNLPAPLSELKYSRIGRALKKAINRLMSDSSNKRATDQHRSSKVEGFPSPTKSKIKQDASLKKLSDIIPDDTLSKNEWAFLFNNEMDTLVTKELIDYNPDEDLVEPPTKPKYQHRTRTCNACNVAWCMEMSRTLYKSTGILPQRVTVHGNILRNKIATNTSKVLSSKPYMKLHHFEIQDRHLA
jgi:hypothetical protein